MAQNYFKPEAERREEIRQFKYALVSFGLFILMIVAFAAVFIYLGLHHSNEINQTK